MTNICVPALSKLAPGAGAYLNEVSVARDEALLGIALNSSEFNLKSQNLRNGTLIFVYHRPILTSQTGRQPSTGLIMTAYWLSRTNMIRSIFFMGQRQSAVTFTRWMMPAGYVERDDIHEYGIKCVLKVSLNKSSSKEESYLFIVFPLLSSRVIILTASLVADFLFRKGLSFQIVKFIELNVTYIMQEYDFKTCDRVLSILFYS